MQYVRHYTFVLQPRDVAQGKTRKEDGLSTDTKQQNYTEFILLITQRKFPCQFQCPESCPLKSLVLGLFPNE